MEEIYKIILPETLHKKMNTCHRSRTDGKDLNKVDSKV